MADALEACHNLDMVHQDVKLENILYDPQKKLYKLSDFGLATIDSAERPGGTRYFKPPEYKEANAKPTKVGDLYSLGMVAYLLFNNSKLPEQVGFAADAEKDAWEKIQDRHEKKSNFTAPEYAVGAISRAIINATRCDPEKRYQSAADMKAAF